MRLASCHPAWPENAGVTTNWRFAAPLQSSGFVERRSRPQPGLGLPVLYAWNFQAR
jgi:hypothetical protein